MMTLQINQAGGWRNALNFDPDRRHQIEFHAPSLADLVGASMRILDERREVVAIRPAGSCWQNPPWANGDD